MLAAALFGLTSLVPGSGWAQSTEVDFSNFIHRSPFTYSTESRGYTTSDGQKKYWSSWFASDGTTMWVAGLLTENASVRTLIAHTLNWGNRDSSKDITLVSDNGKPSAAATDGTTMWVLDREDDKLYAYTLSSGNRDTAKEFTLHSAHQNKGHKWNDMWTDGTTMYLLYSNGHTDSHVYAYALSNGNRDTGKDISLAGIVGGLDQPWGIWSDETTMWIADIHDAKLWAFTLSSRSRNSSKDFTLTARNSSPSSLYYDGSRHLWVADVFGLKMHAYISRGGGV